MVAPEFPHHADLGSLAPALDFLHRELHVENGVIALGRTAIAYRETRFTEPGHRVIR